MNLKALITTLVLGSSSMASADSVSFSGSVKLSLGGTSALRPAPAPRPYQPVVTRPVVVVDDDCHDAPAPVYTPVYTPPAYQPPVHTLPAAQPTWRGPYFNITNTHVGANASQYRGTVGTSKVKLRHNQFGRARYQSSNPTWFDLTEATRIDSGRELFTIGADNGMFKGLKLQALGNGRSHITQVAIEFVDSNGKQKTQKVKLNTWIDRNNPSITIDLDGNYRAIGRIIVYGSTDRGSAYKLMAI